MRFDILEDKGEPEVEDRDTRRLQDACATLKEEVFQGTNVELKPALFVETVTQDKDLKGGRIIDKKDIEDLVNCLSVGESPEQLFFKFFVSPSIVKQGQGVVGQGLE
jgi:hypothetical protein